MRHTRLEDLKRRRGIQQLVTLHDNADAFFEAPQWEEALQDPVVRERKRAELQAELGDEYLVLDDEPGPSGGFTIASICPSCREPTPFLTEDEVCPTCAGVPGF